MTKEKNTRKSASVTRRTIRITILVSISFALIALIIGMVTYATGLINQHVDRAFRIAQQARTAITRSADAVGLSRQVMRVYRSLTPEQRNSDDYLQHYVGIDQSLADGEAYDLLYHMLQTYIVGVDDVYLAMIDPDNNILIYIVDPDVDPEKRLALGEWEELSETDICYWSVELRGNVAEGELTRAQFEEMTRPLIDRAVRKMRALTDRHKGKMPDHIILTGGSSIMPQVLATIAEQFPDVDVRSINPAHAIANGAARYADWLCQTPVSTNDEGTGEPAPEKKHIKLISSHAYGIRYFYDALGEFRICILIPRGVQLPYSAETFSYTRRLNQYESVFTVFELDTYADKDELVPESEGREIMSVALTRTKEREIPVHTETIETLTISEAELLSVQAVDHINGVSVEDTVAIKRK